MHDLPHLAARLYGTPLLLARSKLDVILGALAPRLAGQGISFDGDAAPSTEMAVTPDGIAIVSVVGTLVSRSGYLGAASGLTAYADIAESIEAAATDWTCPERVESVSLFMRLRPRSGTGFCIPGRNVA